MANMCSNTPIKDDIIKGLRAELNAIRRAICSIQGGAAALTNTIYTSDGSLNGNRLIELDEHDIELQSDGGTWFKISPSLTNVFIGANNGINESTVFIQPTSILYTAETNEFSGKTFVVNTDVSTGGSAGATLSSSNATGLGNSSNIQINALDAEASSALIGNFNDGETSFNITATAQSGSSSISYTADTHTFNTTSNWKVNDGTNNILELDLVTFTSSIEGNNGTLDPARIVLHGDTQIINYQADGGHIFSGVITVNQLNLPTQSAPASPNDGDIWREDNTNTGLKIRVNGVTKTITLS